MLGLAWGSAAFAAIEPVPTPPSASIAQLSDHSQVFWAAEIDTFQPGSGIAQEHLQTWGAFAWGSLGLGDEEVPEAQGLLRVSDTGYLTRHDDPGGVIHYRPLLDTAIELDRQFDLDPLGYGYETAWGSLRLLNPDGQFDGLARGTDTDGRRVRVYLGAKAWDRKRQIHVDPAYAQLLLAFAGSAGPLELDEDAVLLPLRDRSYLLERVWQNDFYGGTGGRDGTEEIAELPKPRLRGGTPANPARNITPILVDPVSLIYQVSDGPGTIHAVYQRGYGGDIAFQGTTSNLYSGSTNPGHYRVESTSNGLFFQLGSPPEGEITVDACGHFRQAGAQTQIGAIVRYLMTEDLGLTGSDVDIGAWTSLDANYGYEGAIYTGEEERLAVEVLGEIMAGIGGRLLTGRTGRLRPYMLNAPEGLAREATFTDSEIVRVSPLPLPESVLPAVWRVRVGYARNHTVQTSDIAAAVTEARRQWLAHEWRYGSWSDPANAARYRRPPELTIPSILTRKADAEHVASRLGAIWGAGRRLYDVELWMQPLDHDIGRAIVLRYPVAGLRDGRLAVIVGEQIRAGEQAVMMRVLA